MLYESFCTFFLNKKYVICSCKVSIKTLSINCLDFKNEPKRLCFPIASHWELLVGVVYDLCQNAPNAKGEFNMHFKYGVLQSVI